MWWRARLVWERELCSAGAMVRSPGLPEGGPGLRGPGWRHYTRYTQVV